MIQFEAVVRPQVAERLCTDLLEWDMVVELAAIEVIGSGRRWSPEKGSFLIDMLPKVLITGLVESDDADELVDRICKLARSGRSGDGKIFLTRIAAEV